MRDEIRIAGFGGQGVISIGMLLARSVGQFGDMEVAQTQSYGPEARGGACKTDVVISDETIDYIKPLNLSKLVVMAQPALNIYGPELPDDACIIADTTLVTEIPSRFSTVYSLRATELAEQELKGKVLANMIMFGALLRVTGWAPLEKAVQAVENHFHSQWHARNNAALELGYNIVQTPSVKEQRS